MPAIARAFVRASFAYFVAAFALGALMMLDQWLDIGRWLRSVYLSQLHLLVVGWVTQLAIGVAYWMFPRFLKAQDSRPRGSDSLAWAAFACLNAGLVLRFGAEPFFYTTQESWLKTILGALLAVSGVLQAAAALAFGWLIWGRIRAMEP